MEKIETKIQRLEQVEQLLLSFSKGLHRIEIARKISVHPSTIGRYIDELSLRLPIYETEDRKIAINKDYYLNNISLTVHEALALHLSTCLMAYRTDRQNPHAASALRKIAHSLTNYSKIISAEIDESASKIESNSMKSDSQFVKNLEVITRSWCEQNLVRVKHFSITKMKIIEYEIGIIKIIPYSPGLSIQIVGFCPEEVKLRTLRLDRIKNACELTVKFKKKFSKVIKNKLQNAWGIWYTDDEPVEVELKFDKKVARRVKETIWHKNQQIKEMADGSLLWKAKISEPLEMYPWIRGWGSDVEIIKPKNLRKRIQEEIRKLGEIYG